jgi:hypothetical protein
MLKSRLPRRQTRLAARSKPRGKRQKRASSRTQSFSRNPGYHRVSEAVKFCEIRLIPDSAIKIETDIRIRRKPGAAKTPKRTVSRSYLVLGQPLLFVFGGYPMHRSQIAAKGQKPIVFAV